MNKINDIIKKMRDNNIKVTPQRIAIIKFLEENKIHPTAEKIFNNIIKDYPTISLATIYNTLEKLEEINEIYKLKITDDNKVNYENNLNPHHHFYCKKCKNIFDIDIKCDYFNIKIVEGNHIEEVHGYFKGLCKNCFELI
jgi:Fe2+ or Zn2+ uptake regulation protein